MRSHSKEEIIEALKKGIPVWELDTGLDGHDDILIGGSYEDTIFDICHHFDLPELPEHWKLSPFCRPLSPLPLP